MTEAISPITAPRHVGSKPHESPRRTAVIDIGTTSIRMSIAEISAGGNIRTLESLYQEVDLGKDTFSKGNIRGATIEACVKILKDYRKLLDQYDIGRPDEIRVVATSAVHEAENQLKFIDRVYIATGFKVEPLDEAEANRFAYLAIESLLLEQPVLDAERLLVCEVGGGNTEMLLLRHGQVVHAHSYRLGSLRLRQTLEAPRASSAKVRKMMESQIRRTVERIHQEVSKEDPVQMLALGGDIRFAAAQSHRDAPPGNLAVLEVAALAKLTEKVLGMSTDQLVRQYHLSFPDAETLGPALLAYLQIAREFGLSQIHVADTNFRDGLLKEIARQGTWPKEFSDQIIRSALNLGEQYNFDAQHALHTTKLCQTIFRALADEHQLDPSYELRLCVAALLHDIGNFVSNRSHHKHSMYLILHGELFGLSRRDMLLIALVARYHRRGTPKPLHEGYMTLDREDRIIVAKLAAILRVADALDRSERQRIADIQCVREKDQFVILVPSVEDVSLEQLALKQKGPMFEEVYGMPILVRALPAQEV